MTAQSLVWEWDYAYSLLALDLWKSSFTEVAFYCYFKASDSKLSDPRGRLSKKFLSTAILFPSGKVKHVHVLINMFFCTHTPSPQCSTGSTSCHLTLDCQQQSGMANKYGTCSGCKWLWSARIFNPRNLFFKISKWPIHENFVPSKFGTMW